MIKNKTDLFVILKAIELTSKGFNIAETDFTELKQTWWNAKTKTFQKRMTDSVPEVYFEFADDVVPVFPFVYNNKYVKRNKDKLYDSLSEIPEDCEKIVISMDILKNTMTILKKYCVWSFSDVSRILYDTEYIEELSKLDADYNKSDVPSEFVTGLSRDNTRRFFNGLTAYAYCQHTDMTELLADLSKCFENDTDFSALGSSLAGFSVIDNRLYIPIKPSLKKILKDKLYCSDFIEDACIVLSKNPYDYYYCSYGSDFQSCFALNSSHGGWVGAVVNCMTPCNYMLMLVKNTPQKVSMTGEGMKYPAPYIYARAWCWLSDDGKILVDKVYSTDRSKYETVFSDILGEFNFSFKDTTRHSLYKSAESAEIIRKYRCYFYPDSIKDYAVDSMYFTYDNGDKGFWGNYRRPDLKAHLSSITEVSPTLSLLKPVSFNNHKIFNPKICPITGLEIDDSQDVSVYASKFKNKLDKGLAVLTYIDGFVKVDALTDRVFAKPGDTSVNYNITGPIASTEGVKCPERAWLTDNFNPVKETLDKFKMFLKEDLNRDDNKLEFILLRIINGGQMTWVKLRKDK